MFLATLNNILVKAELAVKRNNYYCPACKQKVHLKIGNQVSAHFAHMPNQACTSPFSEGETIEHLTGKSLIYNGLIKNDIEAHLEYYLKELAQRPDVMFKDNYDRMHAIEFQCSPISQINLLKRTIGYKEASITVKWILGQNYTPKTFGINDSQYQFLQHINDELIGLLSLDVYNKALLFHIPYQKDYRKVDWISYPLKENRPILTMGSEQDYQNYYNYLVMQKYYQAKGYRAFYEHLYLSQKHLHELPNEVLHILPSDYLIKAPSVYWKTLIVQEIDKVMIGGMVQYADILFALKSYLPDIFTPHLFLENEIWLKPIKTYIDYLIEKDYIFPIDMDIYQKVRPFNCYSNENDKIKSFQINY